LAQEFLEGSVLRAGPQLRINVQLVRVRDDFPPWSGRYDQEFIGRLGHSGRDFTRYRQQPRLNLGRGGRSYETSPEAYDLYLRARAMENPRSRRR